MPNNRSTGRARPEPGTLAVYLSLAIAAVVVCSWLGSFAAAVWLPDGRPPLAAVVGAWVSVGSLVVTPLGISFAAVALVQPPKDARWMALLAWLGLAVNGALLAASLSTLFWG